MDPLDLEVEILPPDPYEIAVEVEAQVGPRSPSPTPFKIAESLASSGRKGFSRGNVSSLSSSYQQSGRFESSRFSSTLQSRSSSPSRGTSPLRHSESTTSLSTRNFDGGGRSRGTDPGSRTSSQSAHGKRFESGTLPRNFKSLASSFNPQSSTVSEFRSALRKPDVRGSAGGRGESRSSSPSRKDSNPSGRMSLRKNETARSPPGRSQERRTSSPSRRTSMSPRDDPSRKSFSSFSQSPLRKSESTFSLSSGGHPGRCGSPIREGYDIENQALLRNLTARNGTNHQDQVDESANMSPPRPGYDRSPSVLRKTESSPVIGSRGRDSRSSSPGRRGYETPTQLHLRKTDTSGSSRVGNYERRSTSPSRRSSEAPSKSMLRTSERNTSPRGFNSLPSRKGFEALEQRSVWKTETRSSPITNSHASRNSSTNRRGNSDAPGYSILRTTMNGESELSPQRKNTNKDSKSASSRSHRSSSSSRATSPQRLTSNGGRAVSINLETPRGPGSNRSETRRLGPDDQSPYWSNKNHSHHARSPSPQIQIQRYTSSQSSMESSESGQLSVGSTGRTREEYIMMADVPKVRVIQQREGPGHCGPTQSRQMPRKQELFKPARSEDDSVRKQSIHPQQTMNIITCPCFYSHSLSKHPSREWEEARDGDRDGGSGYLSRAHSYSSLQVSWPTFHKE